MIKLYDHQHKIISEDKKKCGIFTGTGSGKTLTALSLATGKTLVICPKTQREDRNWERQLQAMNSDLDLTVISKETFRRDHASLPRYDTLIIDEAHTVFGATPNTRFVKRVQIPKVSQLFEALTAYINKHKPERIYPCTATIMRSPMTVWACAKALGHQCDFWKFRDAFYFRLPMRGREVFSMKSGPEEKKRLADLVMRIGYTGKLSDFFDVPDQTFKDVFVDITEPQKARLKELPMDFPDAIVLLGKRLQVENGILNGDEFNKPEIFRDEKIDKIVDFSREFPRMIVFSKYIMQIEEIRKALVKDGKKVFIMTGDTKDRGRLIDEANSTDDYVFIVSAQISAGWELPRCEVIVFASRTYSIVDYIQAQGRIHRANHLKKNLYINLIARDGIDHAVHRSLENKEDFNEKVYLNII